MALHSLLNFQSFLMLLCLQLASTTETQITASRVITKPGCQAKCGNVSIPYPFGIGNGCFLRGRFELECNDSLPYPVLGNIKVSNISIPDGEITTLLSIARHCSAKSKRLAGNLKKNKDTRARFSKFTFSNTKNKFIAIGCDTLAYLNTSSDGESIGTGCLSSCNKIEDSTNGTCNGIGCCEASIPAELKTYEVNIESISPTRRNLDFNPCSYAFLTEKKSFSFSSSYLENFRNYGKKKVPAVVDWTISNSKTCEEAQRNLSSYACGPNTNCVKGNNEGKGYRCSCKKGYEGNPYLNTSTGGHCQDIDECSVKDLNNCTGPGRRCTNTPGDFFCFCDKGYKPELKNDIHECFPIQSRRIFNEIVLGASLSLSLLLVTGFGLYCAYRKRKHMKVREEFFKQNGGLILNRLLDEREEDIENSRKGSKMGKGEKKHRSIATIYTEKELSKATNNYHDSQILGRGGFGTVYKGTLSNGKVVAIKKTKIVSMDQNEQFINERVIL